MQVNTIEAPPVGEWQRQADDKAATVAMLEQLARRGSIRLARRPGVMGWLRARLGWR